VQRSVGGGQADYSGYEDLLRKQLASEYADERPSPETMRRIESYGSVESYVRACNGNILNDGKETVTNLYFDLCSMYGTWEYLKNSNSIY
jgi:hypothetical protein